MTEDSSIQRATDWLNEKLYRIFGPPPLGPYDDGQLSAVWEQHGEDLCPVCDQPLGLHDTVVEAESGTVFLHCPGAEPTQGLETGR